MNARRVPREGAMVAGEDAVYAMRRAEAAKKVRRDGIRDTVFGVIFIALGVGAFRFNPEHGTMPAMLLIGFGGVLIDKKLIKVIRRNGGGEGEG